MMLPHKTAARITFCGLMVCWLTAGVSSAASIEIARFFELGAATTDNSELLSDNGSSDLVFNAKPSVELKFSGNRFGAIARGEVEYYRFIDAGDDVVDPRLSSLVRGTLIDNLLYLNTSLVVSKLSPDSNFLRQSDDGNTAAVFRNKIFLDRSFGRTADLYVAHLYSTLAEKAGNSFGSDQNTLEFTLGRNPQYGNTIWGLGGFYTRDSSTQNKFENSSFYGKIGTTFSQTLLGELTVGVESRDLITATDTVTPTTTEYKNSTLWQIDLNWAPSELTTLTVGYGERFFGAGPSFKLKHRVRNSTLLASYTRGVTRQSAALDGITALTSNQNISPTILDTDSVAITNGNLVTPLDEPYTDNRLRLAYKLAGRRSDLIVDAVYSEQERLTGNDTIESLLGRVVFDRRLSEFLSLRLQYDYQKSKASNRPTLNYIENRFAVKVLYFFDGIKQFGEDELDLY